VTRDQKRRALVLALLCAAYVLVFVPANRTGASDVNMLSIFKLDEFGQFHALWKMTSPKATAAETLLGFLAYDHYYYGFPFFAVSALIFWPLRSFYLASNEPGLTAASALFLRELSPLFTALAIAILVALWTRLHSLPRMTALFVFLGALPAVVANNLWWHPDALVLFWVVVTIAALSLDRARLGRWFYAAALACGLATATKTIGLWFFGAVALNLVLARSQRQPLEIALAGARFAVVMLLAIAAASPHYFLPSEWKEIAESVSTWKRGIDVGWGTKGATGLATWSSTLRSGFGWVLTSVALLALCGFTALRAKHPDHRHLAAMILAWALPLAGFLIARVALQEERYLLPILVPLFSCAGSPVLWQTLRSRSNGYAPRILAAAFAALLLAQLGSNLVQDLSRYRAVLEREEKSPSLAFWRQLDAEVLSQLPPEVPVRIFRDLYVYVPPERRFEVHVRWRATEGRDIEESQPDLVLLRRSMIEQYADPASVAASTDAEGALRAHHFHRDARDDRIPGYRRLLASDFAVAFGRAAPVEPGGGEAASAPLP
jgi:4-amino-4-deoxy-L-arabinose transferase-like glycosyltransferase